MKVTVESREVEGWGWGWGGESNKEGAGARSLARSLAVLRLNPAGRCSPTSHLHIKLAGGCSALRGSTVIAAAGLNRAPPLKTRASDKSHWAFFPLQNSLLFWRFVCVCVWGVCANDPLIFFSSFFFCFLRYCAPAFHFTLTKAFVFAPGHSCINDAHMN